MAALATFHRRGKLIDGAGSSPVNPTADLIAAVERATGIPGRKVGRNTRLLCPCHDDRDPSLDIAEGDDGSPLVLCRACQAGLIEVCEKLGLNYRDFLTDKPHEIGEWTPHGEAVAVYDYVNAEGKLLYQVCRTAGKEFPQRRPDPSAKSGWRWNLEGVERTIYRLPKVLKAAAAGERIFIPEGEKDVHALEAAGAVATCNSGGAGKWLPEFARHLHGASEVVVVADKGEDGRGVEHARLVVSTLDGIPFRIVEAAEGKDSFDHLAAGHGLDEFVEIDASLPRVFTNAYIFVRQQVEMPLPLLGNLEDEVAIIPLGGLVLLAGRPGVGKTTLLLDLACHLAAGLPYPPASENGNVSTKIPSPWQTPRPLRIAIIENEGPQEMFRRKLAKKLEVFKPNIEEAGGLLTIQTWRWGAFSFAEEDAAARAHEELEEEAIDLVVGDPLGMLGMEGVGSPADTREFVRLLRPLGLGRNRAFLFLHHFRERAERSEDELARISGSWGGHLDTLITISAMADEKEIRLAYPKVRWSSQANPKPIILGRVYPTASFEAQSEEGDYSLLEPLIAVHLESARNGAGTGWKTAKQIRLAIKKREGDVLKSLEGATHLFAVVTGEQAKALGARAKNAKLWGLKEWLDEDQLPDDEQGKIIQFPLSRDEESEPDPDNPDGFPF